MCTWSRFPHAWVSGVPLLLHNSGRRCEDAVISTIATALATRGFAHRHSRLHEWACRVWALIHALPGCMSACTKSAFCAMDQSRKVSLAVVSGLQARITSDLWPRETVKGSAWSLAWTNSSSSLRWFSFFFFFLARMTRWWPVLAKKPHKILLTTSFSVSIRSTKTKLPWSFNLFSLFSLFLL